MQRQPNTICRNGPISGPARRGLAGSAPPPLVCVQGLGFAGAATAVAVAAATAPSGDPVFRVLGVELPTPAGRERVAAIEAGRFPHANSDLKISAATASCRAAGTLRAGHDPTAYAAADVVIVSVNLDLDRLESTGNVLMEPFRAAIAQIGDHMKPAALVLVESTVPPGTCRDVVGPILGQRLARRGWDARALRLAHTYERVTPGPEYLDSIIATPRVFGADDELSADAARAFLAQALGADYDRLTALQSTVASETAKLLENSFRAVNIALLDEWSHFAEGLGLNLFEIVDAIRVRSTHRNLREPGLGVGGYCLTKDPLLAAMTLPAASRREAFPISLAAVQIGQRMPVRAARRLARRLGDLTGRRVLLLGATYRSGVADTRRSASGLLCAQLLERGAIVEAHDPLIGSWPEVPIPVHATLPPSSGFDVLIFAVAHDEFRRIDLVEWLGATRPLVYDCNHVLTEAQIDALGEAGVPLLFIGRADG